MDAVANQPEYNPNRPTNSLELLDFEASIFQDGDVTGSQMILKASVKVNSESAEQVKVGAKVELPDGSNKHYRF